MISKKNLEPRAIAFIVGVACTVLTFTVLLVCGVGLLKAAMGSCLVALVVGSCTYYLTQQFLYRKIKLVYKFISSSKSNYLQESLQQLLPNATLTSIMTDVQHWADRHNNELEALRQNEAYRRDFLMNLSHEIKTPIFTVQSYLHMLRDGIASDAAMRDKFVSSSVKGIDRLASMINELDELIKLEQGEVKLSITNFDIVDLARDVIDEMELFAEKKNIALKLKTDTADKLLVNADKDKIRQVLVNLLSNSIRYGNSNGNTTVASYVVDDRTAYIEVTDNGIGISETHVPRVFERFYRTDEARGKHQNGSGLGLSIVKHIIEAHGHSVTCRSALDVGSSFGFVIARA